MTTIDNFDISVYTQYAYRITMLEQVNSQLRLGEASSIPPQIQIVDIYPRMTELDLLLGVAPYVTPWALFLPPKKFRLVRRNPFAFYKVAPTLGSLEDQAEDAAMIEETECHSPEEEEEKSILSKCFRQMDKINDMLSFIVGRVGQFIQG